MKVSLDRITRKVYFEVGGSEHSLLFTFSALQEVEQAIGDGLLTYMSRGGVPSLALLSSFMYSGLKAAGEKVTKESAGSILMEFARECEQGIGQVSLVVFYAIAASGILGADAISGFEEQLGIQCDAPKNERKNAPKAEK